MISFENFSPLDGVPIYLQIILYVKRGLAAGIIKNGDEMPSRRMLSAMLGVNPNTAQKACRLLEEDGIISSSPGAKSYITIHEEKISAIRAELFEAQAKEIISAMKQMGLSKDEAMSAIGQLWDDNSRKDELQ